MCRKFIYLIAFVLMAATGALHAEQPIISPESIPGVTRVDAEQLIQLANDIPSLTIIDARITSDRQQGYIEGSVNLPDIDTDCDALSQHIAALDQPVLFYCNGVKCGRSVKSTRIALGCGYRDIYWFRGGYEEWLAKGYPVIKD